MFELCKKITFQAAVAAAMLALVLGCKRPTVPADSDEPDEEPRDNPTHSYLAPGPAHVAMLAEAPNLSVRIHDQG